MLKRLTIICILVISSLILITCKKYPEDTLWLVSPESVLKGEHHLSAFTVDGIDSLPMWDALYTTPPNYNGYKGLSRATEIYMNDVEKDGGIFSSQIGGGSFHFFSNKKYIYVYFKMTTQLYTPPAKYNLFYTTESNWKILKLTKSGTLRIQRTYNNKVYEIQFN